MQFNRFSQTSTPSFTSLSILYLPRLYRWRVSHKFQQLFSVFFLFFLQQKQQIFFLIYIFSIFHLHLQRPFLSLPTTTITANFCCQFQVRRPTVPYHQSPIGRQILPLASATYPEMLVAPFPRYKQINTHTHTRTHIH